VVAIYSTCCKIGIDDNYLYFNALPGLKFGVFIKIIDMFFIGIIKVIRL